MDETEDRTPDENPGGEPSEKSAGAGSAEGEGPTELSGQPSKEPAGEAGTAAGDEPSPILTGAPPPTGIVTQPGRSSGWVWWLVIIVVVLLAVAAGWFFFVRDGQETAPVSSASVSPSPVVWTGSWARLDGVGGGLLIAGGTGAYEVTLYDGVLRPGESVPATVSTDGTQLQFAPPSQFSFGGGPSGPFGATLELDDPDRATLIISDADGTVVLLPLRRVPELLPTNPSPSPSARPSAPPVESPSAP